MNLKSRFEVGSKVRIFQNTERVAKAGRVGESGVVVSNNKRRDIGVLLNGEDKPVYIIEDDLKLLAQ